jgi:uncharacterized protein (TIGR02421 family)
MASDQLSKIKHFSQRLVETQKAIRILDSIRWDPQIELRLKKSKFKEMPIINTEYYQKNELGFEPNKKKEEFQSLEHDIKLKLDTEDPMTHLMLEVCSQYQDVIELIKVRGTKHFSTISKQLYGSSKDNFYSRTLETIAKQLQKELSNIKEVSTAQDICDISAQQACSILEERLTAYFKGPLTHVKISEDITSDAAAGGDIIKLKEGNLFSMKEIEQLEVHEGWVHIGTTQNGSLQKIATWLTKTPPRAIATQEGLAFFMEILTSKATLKRVFLIIHRIIGISKAEDGANLLEIIEFYRTEGYSEDQAIQNARRIFRGGTLEGGFPFTKDIAYLKGLIEVWNFISASILENQQHLIPFLFVGKAKVDDIPLLYKRHTEGIVDAPHYIPTHIHHFIEFIPWLRLLPIINFIQAPEATQHYQQIIQKY